MAGALRNGSPACARYRIQAAPDRTARVSGTSGPAVRKELAEERLILWFAPPEGKEGLPI